MKKRTSQILGWYGLAAIITAYLLITFSILAPKHPLYLALNVTGSVGIMLETFYKKDLQPFILNCLWLLIALAAMINLMIKN